LRYFVLDRGDSVSKALAEQFHALAASRGMQLSEEEPEVVLSIGGDGTLLQAFHRFVDRLDRIAFVGVHTGHLGFYADWKADEIEQLVERMCVGQPQKETTVKYPLVKIELTTVDGVETFLALNEFTLKGADATLVAQLNINDSPFEMFRGDGICISTPSGSTAYNKSLGGALIHPALDSLQIAEIASINNRVYRTVGSSLILPKHHYCDITPMRDQITTLAVDHVTLPHTSFVKVRCSVAEQKVNFARYRPFPFWNRVKEAFIGNDLQ
jgi:NAD+ kinase